MGGAIWWCSTVIPLMNAILFVTPTWANSSTSILMLMGVTISGIATSEIDHQEEVAWLLTPALLEVFILYWLDLSHRRAFIATLDFIRLTQQLSNQQLSIQQQQTKVLQLEAEQKIYQAVQVSQQHEAKVLHLEAESKLQRAESGAFSVINHAIKRTMVTHGYYASNTLTCCVPMLWKDQFLFLGRSLEIMN